MKRKYNRELVATAKCLRKNMTREEKHLWYDFLKGYPVRFYRQKPLGNYIADFYCSKAKLVVELDGSQHFDKQGIKKDAERTDFLEKYGLKVIRIPNSEVVKNFEGVCAYIDNEIKQLTQIEAVPSTASPCLNQGEVPQSGGGDKENTSIKMR